MIPKEFQCPDCDGEGKYWVEDDSPGAGGYARNCKSCNQTGLKLVKISAMELDALRNSITALEAENRELSDVSASLLRDELESLYDLDQQDKIELQSEIETLKAEVAELRGLLGEMANYPDGDYNKLSDHEWRCAYCNDEIKEPPINKYCEQPACPAVRARALLAKDVKI